MREKRAAFTSENGTFYDGEWRGYMRDGYGIQIWKDGTKFDGQWLDNKAHGTGKFYHLDGDVFDG